VLFLDEVDALIGDTLVSLLRQIRAGYADRPRMFPQALILCGVRDVKDYRIHTGNGEIITGGSAFNIKDESLRLGDFTRSEVVALLGQHTSESGQTFASEAVELVWELTQGQPWLVNALARQACFEPAGVLDRQVPVQVGDLHAAKERLVRSRATHLDALGDKLMEPRVRQVILPMLQGVDLAEDLPHDHQEYVLDLGLIRQDQRRLVIANPIYREVIPRELTIITTTNLATRFDPEWCAGADGRLDAGRLIGGFQAFWRKESEHGWIHRDYKEAECQLVIMAYLARVVNGGGRIEREYALGRGRVDLAIFWPHPGGEQRIIIEVKVVYPGQDPAEKRANGLDQVVDYAARIPGADLHLMLFDRRGGIPWEERACDQVVPHRGQSVRVWGM
jgi:hypothetical protein